MGKREGGGRDWGRRRTVPHHHAGAQQHAHKKEALQLLAALQGRPQPGVRGALATHPRTQTSAVGRLQPHTHAVRCWH